MKIAWLIYGHGGTGGGRIQIQIANKMIERGFDVTFYANSRGGIERMSKAPTKPLEEAKGDVAIISDMGAGYKVFEKFRDMKAATKIWYVILYTSEFLPLLKMPHIIKMASTYWIYKEMKKEKATHVTLNIGPMDTANFYPLNDIDSHCWWRSNLVLVYAKKASWVGPEAMKIACSRNKKIVVGALGYQELGDRSYWESKSFPMVDLSTPSDHIAFLNYIYNKSNMYVEVCGASNWGFNYMLGEAMRCKLPVVSTDWEGFSHLVIEGETALTVPACQAEEIPESNWVIRPHPLRVAERVNELFDDEPLRKRLSENAYELVSQYTIDNWIDRLEEMIR